VQHETVRYSGSKERLGKVCVCTASQSTHFAVLLLRFWISARTRTKQTTDWYYSLFSGDVEKAKRKVEGDLKLTQEAVSDLERNKKELEQTIQRKDKEISSLAAKLEDEQSLVAKLQKQIKELQVSFHCYWTNTVQLCSNCSQRLILYSIY